MKSILAVVLCLCCFSFAQCPTGTAPAFTSPNTLNLIEGGAANFTISATGNPAATVTESGALPTGVSFSGLKISGTPQVGTAGSYSVILTATNGVPPDANQTLTINVAQQPPPSGGWVPPVVTSWQWQLSSTPKSPYLKVGMYDIDGFDNSSSTVAALHAQGTKGVCYLSLGTYENFRSDASKFPAAALGKNNGWPGEKWLDIRNQAIRPIMQARFQMCKDKGFDAVEPDNIDGYSNSTGFPLTAADQITYNTWIANAVHALGLTVALKNDNDQVNQLLPLFDFAIVEECVQYSECKTMSPFVNSGKAVFAAEYKNSSNTCSTLNGLNFNGAIFDMDLTGKRTACR